ncbi:MAG TPA: RNA polymerase sigma-70 factor [Chitinophagaceae bacterium]|nr:RNA polymerase sigma-70 factor [Chitinophagaceae bacterium]
MQAEGNYTDKELLQRMAGDDRTAFTILYNRYWLSLYDAAYKRLKNAEQSEDIVQELFVRLWVKRTELEIQNLTAYLHTAIRYRVLSYIERHVLDDSFYEKFDLIESYLDESTDNRLLANDLMSLIEAYIKTLPERRREILIKRMRENMTVKEIAADMNISPKTVQNQLTKALQGLRPHVTPAIIVLFTNLV